MSVRSLLTLFVFLAFAFACVPTQQGSKQATCGENQAFDPIKRVCYSVYIPPLPPVPTLDNANIDGETATTVTLTYSDNKKELARFCSVVPGASLSMTACTCLSGVCTTSITSDYLFYGQTTFTYNVSDNDGTSSNHVVTVNVNAKNHAPVANAGVLAVTEDVVAMGSVSASDVDPGTMDIGTLSYQIVSQGSKGTVSLNPITGAYNYSPYSNANGVDTFTFKVRDNGTPPLYSDSATITVTIAPVNDAPSLNLSPQSVSGTFNVAKSFTLTTGTDIDGDTLTYSLVDAPDYGAISGCLGVGGVGLSCTYTPVANLSDDDRYAQAQIGGIHYVAKTYGPNGNNIRIRYVADLASAGGETVSVSSYDITVHISSLGDTTTAQIVSALSSSSAASSLVTPYIRGSIYESAVAYTALSGGRYYTDSFTYKANDGTVDSPTTASVNISYTTQQSVPVLGADQTINLNENATKTFVLNLATDRNYNETLTYVAVDTSSLHGTLTGCLSGTSSLICTYKPDKNYNGTASFTYRVVDSNLLASATVATVTFIIADVPQAPVLCQYSSFEDANECGPSGCVGTTTPVGKIMPSKSGLYYYQSDVAICWKSTGTTIDSWIDISDTEVNHIADQSINEKDQAVIDSIRIDEGGGAGEDTEQVRVSSVNVTKVSGDNGLLNTSSLSFYYNSASVAVGAYFGGGATSSDLYNFKIVVNPVNGKSGVARVDLVLEDTTSATSAVTFLVTVYPVSAQHKGWADVQAIGPKVSKDGDLRSPTYPCTYSRYNCEISGRLNQACKGTFVPSATTASTSEQYAVFYNTSANKCYYNSSASGVAANWVEFQTVCNISSSYGYSSFSGKASLIGSGAPSVTPVNKNDFYYDITNDACYRSTNTTGSGDWVSYSQTVPVTISWESYQVSGTGSIEGFNVYRRLYGTSFNYKSPINKTVLSANATSYADSATNSWFAPVPKTVYEYEVRPVINSISTDAYGYSQTLKVVVPGDNLALVHRWIANKSMCTKIHASTIDTQNNYRCAYQGPGDNGAGHYDIGSDLFVDVYEAGCNYTSSPTCNTTDGTCIGLSAPNASGVTASSSAYYYERGAGKCYYTATGGAGTWTPVDGTQNFTHNYPELPPAVYMTQAQANTFCSAKSVSGILGSAAATGQLPNRKMQLAYSDWSSSITHTAISTYEAGQALNSSPKCNSNSANGLSAYYSDASIPDSSSFYTLPGSITSGIRSFISGSSKTSTCQSRYGVQDTVGNVAEWVKDRVKCTSIGVCEGVINTTVGVANLDASQSMLGYDTSLTGNFQFKIGDSFGPYGASPFYPSGACNDTDADGICNSYLTRWILADGDYSAGRFWVPLGLPGHVNFTTSAYSSSEVANWFSLIGSTSGIEDEALHEDQITLNTQNIYADSQNEAYGCGAMATGGSYASGTYGVSAAGVYSMELLPCNSSYGYLVVADLTFKAKSSLETNPVYIRFVSAGAESIVTSTSGSTRYITINYNSGSSTATSIAALMNADGTARSWVYTHVSGLGTNSVNALDYTALASSSSATSSRSDVGFRCVYVLP